MQLVIVTLWLFWLETLAFIGFIFWSILTRAMSAPLTGFQKANLAIYTIALLFTLYGTWRYARRRFSSAQKQ